MTGEPEPHDAFDRSFVPMPARRLTGDEAVGAATIADFWRWAYSDVRDNTSRGVFAEWLVGQALGCVDEGIRIGWANHDLSWDGITIEVKSAAYLQSWRTRQHSKIVFSRLCGRAWNEDTGYDIEVSYHADVYVFAVVTTKDHGVLDPLDVTQWEFWVAGRGAVAARGSRSLTLSAVTAICGTSVPFAGLRDAIAAAAEH